MSMNYDLIDNRRQKNAALTRLLPIPAGSTNRTTALKASDDLDFDLRGVAQSLFRRRRWIIGCTAAMLAIAALVCIFMTPQYEAESKLQILKQDTGGLSLGDGSNPSGENYDALDFNLTLQTQLAVLKSDTLASQVIKEVNLDDKSAATDADTLESSDLASEKHAAAILKKFKRDLTVDAIPGTRLIRVSYTHTDPTMAAKIVNQLVSDFVEYTFQVRYKATTKATGFLEHQLVELKSEVENSQARSAQLQKESGIFGEDEHHNIVLTRLEQLNNEVTTAESDRVIRETIYKLSRSGNPELVAGMLGAQPGATSSDVANSVAMLNNLRQQEATLSAEYADASVRYGPAYPRLIQLQERLGSVRSSIEAELPKVVDRAKNEYDLAAQREVAAKHAFAEQKAAAARMNDKATDFLIAKHEADSGRVLYEHLLAKLKEAGVLAGLRSSQLHVVDQATVPTLPAKPNVPLYLVLGGLAGMTLGVVCAFVAESTDRTLRDVGEIENITRIPVLGVIPEAGTLPKDEPKSRVSAQSRGNRSGSSRNALLASLRNPAFVEAFRALRTSLLLSQPRERTKVFMVTSGMAQEGKSFTSWNLAATLACRGEKVLLVDADLRRGTLSKILNQNSKIGLSEVLAGILPEGAYRAIDDVPGLTFMSAGNCSHPRPELLESQEMSALVQGWRQDFAYVVIDTPPVLPVSDAVVLSPMVDAVIVVVRFAVTNQPSIDRTIRVLKDAQPDRLGVLVNAMDVRSPEFYHYSGSNGYDKYHYGDAGKPPLLTA